MDTRDWIALGALLAAAAGVRMLLHQDLPAILTNDSWNYLKASADIRHELDYFTDGLRDVGLPGYASTLALLSAWCGSLHSDAIVLAQMGVGITATLCGWLIGRLAGSRRVALLTGGALAFHPVYLLNEHAVMTETLALFLLAVVVLAAFHAARSARTFAWSPLLGALVALCVLVRLNLLFVAAGAAIGALVCSARRTRSEDESVLDRTRPALGSSILAALAVSALLVAPWLWRNHAAYGRAAMHLATYRGVLIYKAMHHPLDATAPTLAAVSREIGRDLVDFHWLRRLGEAHRPAEAEEVAKRVFFEQIRRQPRLFARQVLDSFAGFFGFMSDYGDDRSAMLFWFREIVSNVERADREYADRARSAGPRDLIYDRRPADTTITRVFARIGAMTVRPGRAIAALLLLAIAAGWALRAARGDAPVGSGAAADAGLLPWLAGGYLATAAFHAITLSDSDRYSTLFDFVGVLVAALLVDRVPGGHELLSRREGRGEPEARGARAATVAALGTTTTAPCTPPSASP